MQQLWDQPPRAAASAAWPPTSQLAGLLPPRFELATVYTAAVPVRAAHPDLAVRFIKMMTAPDTATARERCGFEA